MGMTTTFKVLIAFNQSPYPIKLPPVWSCGLPGAQTIQQQQQCPHQHHCHDPNELYILILLLEDSLDDRIIEEGMDNKEQIELGGFESYFCPENILFIQNVSQTSLIEFVLHCQIL